MTTTIGGQAQEALRLAEADPRRGLLLAREAAALADAERDAAAGAVAARAWGLAAFHLEDPDTAVRHLRNAIALGRRAASPQLAAEARMTLAYVLNWRGRPQSALRAIDTALRDLTGVERARAQAQRGAILHQLGRLDEALMAYRTALPVLRRTEDWLWLQRVLSNRGNLRARRREFAAAEADLHEAERLCRQLELDLSVGFVQHNLGYVHSLRCDIPAALEYFDRAEQCFRALGSQLGPLLVDRSELLLSARLVAEARRTAAEAVGVYQQERRWIVLPEARLLLARAAVLDGDLAGALQQARSAALEFGRQRQAGWAALARLTVLTIQLAGPQPVGISPARVERAVDALAGGWPEAALEGRLAAGKLALDRGQTGQARGLLRLASRGRHRGPATLRARSWYAEALLRQTSDNPRGATTAARAGLRILDEHAAALGSTDLRAHVAGHRTDLVEFGTRAALRDGRPDRVFVWAELGRASHLHHPPARPPDDRTLAAALSELRAVAGEINELHGAGPSAARLRQRRVVLEGQIRGHHHRQRGDRIGSLSQPPSLGDLGEALGEVALLEFVRLEETLHVVTLVDGRPRLRTLGRVADVCDLVERIPFALHRLVRQRASAASRSAAEALLRDSAARLDTTLLGGLPEVADRPLVVIPTEPLQSLCWSVLPSCVGRPLTVSPSAALWHSARRQEGAPGHAVIAAGPGLVGAHAEAEAVAEIYDATAMLGTAATIEGVTSALSGAALAHLATHGWARADNPLFSALRFADGPLMVYDLEKLQRAPHTVVLAACQTGRPVVCAGDELLGLSATFLAQGTAELVAPVLEILDTETAPLMVAFHRRLAAGEPVAVALASAQQQVAAHDLAGMATAAGFVCFGAGFERPALPRPADAGSSAGSRPPVRQVARSPV